MNKEQLIADALVTRAGRQKLAESMLQPRIRCPVCGETCGDFVAHCDLKGDREHLAASVMEA